MIDKIEIKHPLNLILSDIKNIIFCGIYKITSPCGKIYIGQSINIYKRWYCNYKNLHCKGQSKLYNSFKKYGIENHKFEIIHICELNISILEYWEDYYINFFNSMDRNSGLNLRGAGKHGKVTEESKERNRQSHLGKVNVISKEAIERREMKKLETKLRKEQENKNKIKKNHGNKNKKRSEEFKQKIREKLKDKPLSKQRIEQIRKGWDKKREEQGGKIIFTKEHRRKLSEVAEKRPVSEKTIFHLKKNWIKGRKCLNRKVSEEGRLAIKLGWNKRRENKIKQTEIFNNLSKEDQDILINILVITKMFGKRKNKPRFMFK